MRKLSASQIRVLRNVAEGLCPLYHARGQSQHGGLTCTLMSLQRRGLLTWEGELTEAGRKALETGRS